MENATPQFARSGHDWFWTARGFTLYTHTQPPNGSVPDCMFQGSVLVDMATARSRHGGGVQALMADGSLRFTNANISLPIWRGLASRNGAEVVE
jgi:prepilin-type processing-associated H-X9-DG protein